MSEAARFMMFWIPTSEAWIQADGLHDHLLLKVGEKLNEVAVFVPKGIYPKGGC
jgi:hypothetical protein